MAHADLGGFRAKKRNLAVKLTKAAQTGNSRFLEECDNWSYDKTEDLEIKDILERNFSHLIVENIEMNVHGYTEKYRLVKTVHQYSKIK